MKYLMITIVFIFLVLRPATAQEMKGMDMSKKEVKGPAEAITYTCPMHPEIHALKPGNCPKCGMKLVREKPKKAAPPVHKMEPPAPKETAKENTGDMPAMEMDSMKKPQGKPINTTVNTTPPKTVRYDLYVADTLVNYSGKTKKAIAINGSIPAPTLEFTEGDTAEIYVHNNLKKETSIHWHGIILPNRYDGVPYLTTAPIKPGQTHIFKFPVVQHGTYWYHSHTRLQEQSGMYGALVLHKRNEAQMKEYTIVLSDWSDMRPKEIHRSLHNQTDWFGIRKRAIQSYGEAIRKGHFKTKINNEWKRMLAMDVSDVAYDKFLINGRAEQALPQYKAGDKVRLRIVNGSASSYFWLKYAGGKITVVSNDGNDVEPVAADRLIIAVAETYDLILTIPPIGSYEFLATPEDRTKSASLWLGTGMKMPAGKLPGLKYFAGMKMMNGMMKMNGDMKLMEGMDMSNQAMDMNTVMYPEITGEEGGNKEVKTDTMYSMKMDGETGMKHENTKGMPGMKMGNEKKTDAAGGMYMQPAADSDIVTLNYGMLRSPEKTTLPAWPVKTLYFELTGNMNRYVWTINNKTVSEADKILIHKGENIRIVMFNNTMMRHPMHLHGHFFRVINGQGEYAPLKNVIDIMPMETDTLEFAATESGDWFFHCHILYHMMSGMGRVFSYENSAPNPELPDKKYARRKLFQDDREFHTMIHAGFESNGADGYAMRANTRYKAQTMWHLGMMPEHGYESETVVGRYIGKMQWWHVFAGYDYHYKKLVNGADAYTSQLIRKNIFGSEYRNMLGQVSDKNNRSTIVTGIQYILPMLVIAEFRADLNGKLRFQLSREDVPVTSRLRFNIMANTDKEYTVAFRYIVTKYFSLSTHYDSDMGLGAGVTVTY